MISIRVRDGRDREASAKHRSGSVVPNSPPVIGEKFFDSNGGLADNVRVRNALLKTQKKVP
ncbi:MAG: hypothetical protein K8R21_04190 [Leptospira sp.]|nr:hypothetical protein [Leptospira sp.]